MSGCCNLAIRLRVTASQTAATGPRNGARGVTSEELFDGHAEALRERDRVKDGQRRTPPLDLRDHGLRNTRTLFKGLLAHRTLQPKRSQRVGAVHMKNIAERASAFKRILLRRR